MTLKTLSRKDPEFESYLRGSFSKTHRALPIQSLNVATDQEQVIYQIVELSKIEPVSFFKKWSEVFKLRAFLLLGAPLFLVLAKNVYLDEIEMDLALVVSTLLGCLTTFMSINLFNDYYDHMNGVDRFHPELAKRPIQNGWVTAEVTQIWAGVWGVLGFIFSLPALFVHTEELIFILLAAAILVAMWVRGPRGIRYHRVTELFLFLLAGPLLTLGFQLALIGEFDPEAVWIGIMTGWLTLFLRHLKNFQHLLVNSQGGFSNSIAVMGFEKSKIFLSLWWLFFVLQWILFHLIYWSAYPKLAYLGGLILLIVARPFWVSVYRLKSSVGSEVKKLVKLGQSVFMISLTWWLLQSFFLVLEDLL